MKYGIGDFKQCENDLHNYIYDTNQLKHALIELESRAQDLTKKLHAIKNEKLNVKKTLEEQNRKL